MKKNSDLVGTLLQKFFIEYLCRQKHASTETVGSYRDTWRLLLQYVNEKHRIAPAALRVNDLNASMILAFLDYLEEVRKNSVKSRNVRLAAIRAFFRLVALNDPSNVHLASSIMAIPTKRTSKRLVHSLSRDEIDALLAAPDLTQQNGRRDHTLLLTLYNTGARASEIISLKQTQITFGACNFLYLHGKGRKERAIPLWTKSAHALRTWLTEISHLHTDLVFPSAAGQKLTRNGLDYILQRAVRRASSSCPSLSNKTVTPHMIRHSTATHLLNSGVDISTIALWLGHESIETTHIYLESDLDTKEHALSKLAPAGAEIPRFKATDEVLAFLASL
jgi:site-specific recombinase XerD